jgi:hypothetical protein
MPTIDEKRVYTDTSGTETVFAATGVGLVSVSVSDDLVGGFGISHRCRARDVAVEPSGTGRRVAVAAAEDVFVADVSDVDPEVPDALSFAATGFGPASAVGFDGRRLLAGDDEGRVARFEVAEDTTATATGTWTDLGDVGAVRAVAGDFVAAVDGVHRVTGDGLTSVGLDDARDVSVGVTGDAVPLAATGEGLFKLGNGWMTVREGTFEAISVAADGRAHAVSDGSLLRRDDAGAWATEPIPVDEAVVSVAYGANATYAVTDAGTFLVETEGNEWRHHVLGLHEIGGLAVA